MVMYIAYQSVIFHICTITQIIAKQRAFIYDCILERTKHGGYGGLLSSSNDEKSDSTAVYSSSSTIYEGLELFKNGEKLKNVLEVPGVVSAGWKLAHFNKPSGSISCLNSITSRYDLL